MATNPYTPPAAEVADVAADPTQRPTSVSVICWILIVSGVFSVFSTFWSMSNPLVKEIMAKSVLPLPLQFVMTFVGIALTIVCGIAMLKGRNWARLAYVIWGAIGMLIGLVTSPVKGFLIPGLVFFVIIAIFLFRPKANAYFAASKAAPDVPRVPPA